MEPSTAFSAASLLSHAQETVHGDENHAQSVVHGEVVQSRLSRLDPAALLDLMPGCETPGFDWASATALKVWHALFDHARRHGIPNPPSSTELGGDQQQEPCLYCVWAVDLMGRLLDMSRNTVGSALKELVDLGWIRKSTLRNKGGVFSGFEYMIVLPPTEPTRAAIHRYAEKVDKKFQDANEKAERLRRMSPDYRPMHDEDEPLPDPFERGGR
jgi:hypothetical protein